MEVSASLKKAIENYINGDQSAFTVIYNESHRYIYVCVNNVMSGNDNKEDMICDIMQETYLEICKHINSLQNVNQFLSWAGTIATRKCYEYIKKTGKYTLLNEDESFDTLADDDNIIPEEIMQNKEKQRLLREIIQNELTEMQKLCVVGYFYNEMKQSEIAKELGIPENSVKSHLLRAKAKIKESVLDLEKNKGTKLYSVAPLLLLLFVDEIKDCVVSPAIGQAVSASVGVVGVEVATAGAGATSVVARKGAVTTTGATASTAGANVATAAASAVKVKAIVIASVAAVAVGGIGTGIGIALHNAKEDEPVKVVGTAENDESTEDESTEDVTTEETATEEPEQSIYYVASGATYYVASTGKTLTEGEKMPIPGHQDVYMLGDYKYENFAGNYWKVTVCDTTKTNYEKVLDEISGIKIVSLRMVYMGCKNMTKAPEIPQGITNLEYAFRDCVSLIEAPEIPQGVINMNGTFYGCSKLTKASTIPESVINMNRTFSDCISLEEGPEILTNSCEMTETFFLCKKLIVAPKLPEGVTILQDTFCGCESLVEAPEIPEGVTVMEGTFKGCKSLTDAPELPESVISIKSIFSGCVNLRVAPVIGTNVLYMDMAFDGCASLEGKIYINTTDVESAIYCFSHLDLSKVTLVGDEDTINYLIAESK